MGPVRIATASVCVFNTLLSAAPKQLAGDIGAWRGLVHNLSGSVGIAVASAFAVGVLSATLASEAKTHPDISDDSSRRSRSPKSTS